MACRRRLKQQTTAKGPSKRMCGIVGILGREPVAGQLVDALKRLEYRGYDSAGIATLEHGALARRRAEGKLHTLENAAGARAARRHYRHRPYPLGDPRQADREQRPSARHRPRRGRAQRHHREFPRAARGADQERRQVRQRDRHRGGRPSGHRRDEEGQVAGRGGGGRAQAVARRLRARLPVRRRGRSDDRRAQGLAARGRLRRRRDVSRLRRHRAGAVHRHHQLSRRRRLGGADAQGRRDPRRAGPRGRARGDQVHRLGAPGRQGQPPPLHGQGNPRAAGSGRPHARALHRHGRPRQVRAAGQIAVRLDASSSGCRSRPAAPPFMPGWSRNTGSSASPGCRSRSISPPNSAIARRRSSRAISPSSSRSRARPPTRWRRCAMRKRAQAAHSVGRQRADLDHRARKRRGDADAGRARDRRRLDQGLHLPARGAGLPGDRRRPRARRIVGQPTSRSWCAR